jgi:hypothetical protein
LNGAAASSASRPAIIAARIYRRDLAAKKTIAAKFFLRGAAPLAPSPPRSITFIIGAL